MEIAYQYWYCGVYNMMMCTIKSHGPNTKGTFFVTLPVNKEYYTLVPGARCQAELWPHIWVPLYDTAHEMCSSNTKAVEPVASNSQKIQPDVDQCLTETVTLLISVVWQWIPSILSIQLMKNWMPDWLKQSEQPTMTTTNITQLLSPTHHKLHYYRSLHSLSQSSSFGKTGLTCIKVILIS